MDENQMHINPETREFLREAAKWAYFLSIVGFVMIGFFVLLAIFAGSIFSAMGSMGGQMGAASMIGGTFLTVIYLLFAILYFFPVYYLFKFASNLKTAVRGNNSDSLSVAFSFLKSHYKFIGILTIVMIALYALVFIIGIIGVTSAM